MGKSRKMQVSERAGLAKAASIRLGAVKTESKNAALTAIAKALQDRAAEIVAANERDLAAAASGLPAPLLKRLKFDHAKLDDVCAAIHSLIKLPDPVGHTLCATELDADLELYRVSCPIGVLGVVFESRPDALVQISTLCLKSANACLLKGGAEAAHTNRILADTIAQAAQAAGMPPHWLSLLETRQDVADLLDLDDRIDLIIPRGSNEFVRHIMANTNIPVLGHADGICHVYIDADADLDMAVRITVDSKCQYVAVCNAAETLLVDAPIAPAVLPAVRKALQACSCTLKGCPRTQAIIPCEPATDDDWATEYLDAILSVRVVDGLEQAIEHINRYGSGHTDAIVTADREKAERFMNLVDSADVFWNASTRFSDGYRYGLGAEVGISTNKIHARGPVGLDGLVIYKWKLLGKGQVVADYSGPNARKFTHKKLR
jgi:glutamate-5-semialdehyde dehydrogenase